MKKIWLSKIFILYFICMFMFISEASAKEVPCGKEWINIDKGNPNLIGIYVQQLPDSRLEEKYYKDHHPVMIIYVFKKNWIHSVFYTPSGQVRNAIWKQVKPTHWVYGVMKKDFREDLSCYDEVIDKRPHKK
jgi:hypothetical protein